MPDKYALNINGVIYDDGEKVEILWNFDEWRTATLISHSGVWGGGWAVMDSNYDSRPLNHLQGIRKLTTK